MTTESNDQNSLHSAVQSSRVMILDAEYKPWEMVVTDISIYRHTILLM